ncbi:anthranilate synthase component I family protein [Carboxylicivirga sp. N1Y90]|uniref:anthranilate synthase component I family protein n=1 Tax=Carboxylicivirga fragile TaxID=3417571 RepID=UPI003D342474|nr:anthranilate synthase component I family protein [Marinilabiliaceae bacterium N1Y90]
MRKYIDIHPKDDAGFKQLICQSTRDQGIGVVLDGNGFEAPAFIKSSHRYDFVAGIQSIGDCTNDLTQVQLFHKQCKDWLLGFLSYDVKNQLEDLSSNNLDRVEMPDLYFFRPRYLFLKDGDKWQVGYLDEYDDIESIQEFIDDLINCEESEEEYGEVKLNHQVSHHDYLKAIEKVQWHIQRGDIYELNYCMEFFVNDINITPQCIYQRLKEISPTPFSAFVKYHDKFLMGASPERYMKKDGRKIISQPIKGTSSRDNNPFIDKANKDYLINSEKERAENIMITDLVRNDLSRVAKRGSVQVDELCGVYSFKQVHQMISTVSAELKDDATWMDAIKTSFPMGSMTGAPKVSAMKLIEEYEQSKRGLYSGTVGYITPEGDFDFNVVIRSVLYNRKKRYMSFMVGGAITNKSDAQKEYEECLLKASAIMKVFNIQN